MSVAPCQINHSKFLQNFQEFQEEEVVPCADDLHARDSEQRWLKGLVCRSCQYCPAVQTSHQVWEPLPEILQTKGWKVANTEGERWLQSLLNNVVYYLNEPPDYNQKESDYALPAEDDIVLLCWSEGSPVGFCSVKCRGSPVPGTGGRQTFSLDIIDTVFIRKSHRGRGLATSLIDHLIQIYPSSPISNGMETLLLKYLAKHAEKRDLFWLCSDQGQLGDKTNIWFRRK